MPERLFSVGVFTKGIFQVICVYLCPLFSWDLLVVESVSLILSIFGCVQRSISGRKKGNEFERLVRNNLVKPELVLLGRTGNK